jgi:hypothetical protein
MQKVSWNLKQLSEYLKNDKWISNDLNAVENVTLNSNGFYGNSLGNWVQRSIEKSTPPYLNISKFPSPSKFMNQTR